MPWVVNYQKKRAFRVVRRVAARDVFVLINAFGAQWEEPPEKLVDNGYQFVERKPRLKNAGL